MARRPWGCGVAWSILRALGACDGSSNLPSPTPSRCTGFIRSDSFRYGMARETRMTDREWHRRQAAALFNRVWRLLEAKRRTQAEDDEMIHAAHASRYHWGVVGKPVQMAIGEWQVSHVYAVLKRPEPASYHATRCLALCREHRIGDFPLAFAYEALARAAAVAGHPRDCDRFIRQAQAAAEHIEDAEDRALLLSDLKSIPRLGRKASSA